MNSVVFLGKIKFYDEIVAEILNIVRNIDIEDFRKTIVFVWSEEEGEIFWDSYDDAIRFGIPLSSSEPLKNLENKIRRAVGLR